MNNSGVRMSRAFPDQTPVIIPTLSPARRGAIAAAAHGSSLTVSWAFSYHIAALLAAPMAADLGLSPV